MALYPAVQKRAQEEIDRVLGTSRLPGFQDRDNLPYINAMAQEVLRWHPIAPVGFVHKSSEEDIYEGYRIPKGAIMIPNIWYGPPLLIASCESHMRSMYTDVSG